MQRQAEAKGDIGAREEDLLAVQVNARADHVPNRECGPVVITVLICVIPLAIAAVIAVALRLPPAPATPPVSW